MERQPGLQAGSKGNNSVYQANPASSSRIWILESKDTAKKRVGRHKQNRSAHYTHSPHVALLIFLIRIYVYSGSMVSVVGATHLLCPLNTGHKVEWLTWYPYYHLYSFQLNTDLWELHSNFSYLQRTAIILLTLHWRYLTMAAHGTLGEESHSYVCSMWYSWPLFSWCNTISSLPHWLFDY